MASFHVRVTTSLIKWGVIVLLCLASVLVVLSFQQKNNLQTRVRLVQNLIQKDPDPEASKSGSQSKNSGSKNSGSKKSGSRRLQIPDQDTLVFNLAGWSFNAGGVSKDITAEVQTSFVHSFSPGIEIDVAKKFVDPAHENVFFANSPAIRWFNGSLVLVCRIWLDKEKYTDKTLPLNDFSDNYLYTQTFNAKLEAVTRGRILAIPVNKKPQMGDGPIEPRTYEFNHRLYTTFNAAVMFPWKQKIDWTMIYDNDLDVTYVPEIKGGSPPVFETTSGVPRDKHWMALIQNNELYFVHNLDPLNVMKCSKEGKCDFVFRSEFPQDFIFNRHPYIGRLRGGTPFEHYKGDYYVSIAHGTMVTTLTRQRLYTSHLIVLAARTQTDREDDKPSFRLVYVSDAIQFADEISKRYPQVRQGMYAGFIFPVSLLIEDEDSFVIGGHVNDHSAILVRLRGVRELMEVVMEVDRKEEEGVRRNPPAGFVRRFLRDMIQNRTGVSLLV